MNAGLVLTPSSPQTAGVLKCTVHTGTETPPQGEEKALLWQQQSDSSRHCCPPGLLQHQNTEPLSPGSSCTLCQHWAQHQRGHGKDSSAPMESSGQAGQDSCTSFLDWRRGCTGNKPGETSWHWWARWALAAVLGAPCNHEFLFHQSGTLHSYDLHGLCQELDLSQNRKFKWARKVPCKHFP